MNDYDRVWEGLRRGGLRLAVAESCTGGLLASMITDVAGSSDYFLGGVVSYSDEVKESLLGVPHELLVEQGAVSDEVALAMAWGVRRLLRADVSLAITGVAGPGGGTPLKPVGLVYVALAAPDSAFCREFRWASDRTGNKELSARAALDILAGYLR